MRGLPCWRQSVFELRIARRYRINNTYRVLGYVHFEKDCAEPTRCCSQKSADKPARSGETAPRGQHRFLPTALALYDESKLWPAGATPRKEMGIWKTVRKLCVIWVLIMPLCVLARAQQHNGSIPEGLVWLTGGWRYQAGDNTRGPRPHSTMRVGKTICPSNRPIPVCAVAGIACTWSFQGIVIRPSLCY